MATRGCSLHDGCNTVLRLRCFFVLCKYCYRNALMSMKEFSIHQMPMHHPSLTDTAPKRISSSPTSVNCVGICAASARVRRGRSRVPVLRRTRQLRRHDLFCLTPVYPAFATMKSAVYGEVHCSRNRPSTAFPIKTTPSLTQFRTDEQRASTTGTLTISSVMTVTL